MNFTLILPELSLLGFAALVILLDLFIAKKGWLPVISIIGLLVSCGLAAGLWNNNTGLVFNNVLSIDNFAVFFKFVFLGVAVLVILSSVDYGSKFSRFQGEYYALILLSTLGMMLMASATELITLFISLELVNLSFYSLVGFLKEGKSTEAGLKYLLLSATASAILLFGMALIYGLTGQTQLSEIAKVIANIDIMSNPAVILGLVLLVAGFGFKIAMVPFHVWVPDVYEAAPTPITAYISAGGKAAGVAIFLRVFYSAFISSGNLSVDWGTIIAVLATLTMTLGNIVAIQQTNIKRMLGYSSIAQVGYIMVGIAAVGLSAAAIADTQSSILFFLVSYSLTNVAAFAAIIAITKKINTDQIDKFSGMGKRSPLVALALTLCMVSLIGLPPAVGFMAKFYIFSAAAQQGLLWLVLVAVFNSVISAYYYLRVVKYMWMGNSESSEGIGTSNSLKITLVIAIAGILILGVVPSIIMNLAKLAQLIGVN